MKDLANEMMYKLERQENDRMRYNRFRSQYQDLALRVSHLFMVIVDLVNLEQMYVFPLENFIKLIKFACFVIEGSFGKINIQIHSRILFLYSTQN